jgi:hypothetical protein
MCRIASNTRRIMRSGHVRIFYDIIVCRYLALSIVNSFSLVSLLSYGGLCEFQRTLSVAGSSINSYDNHDLVYAEQMMVRQPVDKCCKE